jgi:Domain of unknown function (DUF4175)
MNEHSKYVAARLEAERRAKDRARRLAWALSLCAAVLAVVVGVSLVDYWWALSFAERAAGAGLMALVVVGGLVQLVRLMRHSTSAKRAALDMETQRPDLGCVVSTAAEYLSGEQVARKEYEPELVEALQEAAAKRLLRVEAKRYRNLSYAGSAMAVTLVTLLLFLLLASGSLTALERVANPWSSKTYTRVEVKPGNVEIPAGHDLQINALFTGRLPKAPQLRWRKDSAAKWQTVAMTGQTNGAFSSGLTNVHGTVTYQVAGGDALSPQFAVRTYIPPAVKDFKVEVRFPDYTKRKPVEEHIPSFSVLRASRLTFRIATTAPVSAARLRFAHPPNLELAMDAEHRWTAALQPTNDLSYWIELTDAAGHKGGNTKPYHIKLLPDKPPTVEIVDPGMDIRAEPTNKVNISIAAADDFGVGDIKLIFRKLNGPQHTILCAKNNPEQKEATATAQIDLAPLRLQPYELVEYHAEATDNNTLDGPGIGKSPVYFIEYTTKGEPLSASHGSGQRINLLELEKQIIAATTAVTDKTMSNRFPEVATIQRQTKSYAEIFRRSYLLVSSPAEAHKEFTAAIDSMDEAATRLDKLQRQPALDAEDSALEHLYQVTRLLPPMQACMCHGQGTKIVLDAIEKLRADRNKKREQELPKLIAQAKKLAANQTNLAAIYHRLQQQPPGKGGNTNASPSVAQAQQRLGDEASALAERLRELSGKDPRVGVDLSQEMGQVASHLATASGQIVRGDASSALRSSGFGLSALASVIARLEQLLNENSRPTDMATEEYPKEFEPLVSAYLRRLSYAR